MDFTLFPSISLVIKCLCVLHEKYFYQNESKFKWSVCRQNIFYIHVYMYCGIQATPVGKILFLLSQRESPKKGLLFLVCPNSFIWRIETYLFRLISLFNY